MPTLFQDLRFALRVLLKRPWLSATLVLILALGIGVNTAAFTLFNAVLVRGLPFPNGERVVFVESANLERSQRHLRTSYADLLDWRESSESFSMLAGGLRESANLSDDAGPAVRVDGVLITANAFSVLGVAPALGRDLTAADEQPGAPRVVLLSHGLWQDRYGADPALVGQAIRLDGEPYTVVGVMPPGFRFPVREDLWTPIPAEQQRLPRDVRNLQVFGLLSEGSTINDAQRELAVVARRLEQQYPDSNEGMGVHVITAVENFNGGGIAVLFVALLGAVGCVLLIVCANAANVQLARTADRAREISIRTALGAGRARIVRQLLIESLTLSCLGGAAGLAASVFAVDSFDAATRDVRPYFVDFGFDAAVFAYFAAACVLTGVLFGLFPALQALRANVNGGLKQGERSQTASPAVRRFSAVMVVGQVAVSLVLLAGAGLMMRSFWNLYAGDVGVRAENRLTGLVAPPESDYPEEADLLAFHDRLLESLRALPGVRAVASASTLPAGGWIPVRVQLEGVAPSDPDQLPKAALVAVDSHYFAAFDAPLDQGRAFTDADGANAPGVAVVNNAFARKHWPDEDALGKRFRLIGRDDDAEWVSVVGVSRYIRQNDGSSSEPQPVVYRPFAQAPQREVFYVLHASVEPSTPAPQFRDAVSAIDANLPVQDLMPFTDRLARHRWGYRVFGSVFSVLALIAAALAAVGIFALVAASVRRRRREFGIRLALGAAPQQILWMVLEFGLRRVLIGVAVGLPGAYLAALVLESLLVGVEPSDVLTLTGVAGFLLLVAAVACWLPARRAVAIDPAVTLRNE